MEEVEQFVIPTLSKSRISQLLSYPIGAEAISNALYSCDQRHGLKLHFYMWSDHGLRRGRYEFLRVEYLKNAIPAEDWPLSHLWRRSPQHRWEIIVQPVPREERNATKQFILGLALPEIQQWLKDRSRLDSDGSDILAFFYNKKTRQFETRSATRLGPTR